MTPRAEDATDQIMARLQVLHDSMVLLERSVRNLRDEYSAYRFELNVERLKDDG